MAASTWTRAPFCEVWGKPESCRTLQETFDGLIISMLRSAVKMKKLFVCPFRSHSGQFAQAPFALKDPRIVIDEWFEMIL